MVLLQAKGCKQIPGIELFEPAAIPMTALEGFLVEALLHDQMLQELKSRKKG